ncbi:MAG: M3 family oligoendopeptidase [Thermomicrobiales bacterium]
MSHHTDQTAGAAGALPHWDLDPIFPGLESPEFSEAFDNLLTSLDGLDTFLPAEAPPAGDPAVIVDEALGTLNTLSAEMTRVGYYLFGLIATNTRNDAAQAKSSELQARGVALEKAFVRFAAWLAEQDVEALIAQSPVAQAHAYPLRREVVRASHFMSPAEEALAADLGPAAGGAWSRLHSNASSQIMVAVPQANGDTVERPMTEVRNLAHDPDREVRRRAWAAEVAAWKANALPLAAALNGVKGETVVLAERRRWPEPLDTAVFENAIDREILDAMIAEARAAFPEFRRYLRLKAAALKQPTLTWYDLFAPMGASERSWSWPEATAFVTQEFAAFSPRMGALAERSVAEQWIDAEPRPGKVGGAFCMGLGGGVSRVLQNFAPGYDAVSTLTHELGHAYHNVTQTDLLPLQREMPSALAETASTFCETIIKDAALAGASRQEQIYILEQSLQGSTQIVVDIISRFDFESAIFAKRKERELSADEFCELMLAAQEGTYGDGLDPEARHPYMWAVKGHYYRTGESFYNFPYLFGLLFGLGLYAESRHDRPAFMARYDALLADTGLASASDLAARFGIDLRVPEFWRAGLDVIRADIDRLEALLAEN